MVGRTEIDLDAREAIHRTGPDEYATVLEWAHRSLAVLAELKPARSRAWLLQAAGRTYFVAPKTVQVHLSRAQVDARC
jgi:hypothetical protein